MSSIRKPGQPGKAMDKQEGIHPYAIPFLWLGNKKVIDRFIWIPFFGLSKNCMFSRLKAGFYEQENEFI